MHAPTWMDPANRLSKRSQLQKATYVSFCFYEMARKKNSYRQEADPWLLGAAGGRAWGVTANRV